MATSIILGRKVKTIFLAISSIVNSHKISIREVMNLQVMHMTSRKRTKTSKLNVLISRNRKEAMNSSKKDVKSGKGLIRLAETTLLSLLSPLTSNQQTICRKIEISI